MTTSLFHEMLENLIPKRLDDIIRINRDKCRLALATEKELEALESSLSDLPVRYALTKWQIVMIHITSDNGLQTTSPRLIGRLVDSGQSWMTSYVVSIDMSNGLIQTKNSGYRVIGERIEEAELDLFHICTSLNQWGVGQYFGVPEFFY